MGTGVGGSVATSNGGGWNVVRGKGNSVGGSVGISCGGGRIVVRGKGNSVGGSVTIFESSVLVLVVVRIIGGLVFGEVIFGRWVVL